MLFTWQDGINNNAKALFDEDVLRKVRGGRPARSKALDLGSRLEGVHGFESHPPHLFLLNG